MAAFYDKLLRDESIGYIFTDVAKINLETHLPHIADFWEQNILRSASYRKNVLKIHLDLNALTAFTPNHFRTWLSYLNETIDEHFCGDNAELMKTRALSVATVMQLKMQTQ